MAESSRAGERRASVCPVVAHIPLSSEKQMECRTKDELEQHLSDIRRLASNAALASADEDAAVRAERFAIGLLKEHDASGHGGKRCPFATRL
jgi:hypothetical protein